MAFVFKVKFQGALRRWVAPEAPNADSFAVTFKELESKIRELFHLSSSASLVITYVDKDNDVVTLADDQDLIDACLVQRLDPLRLDVAVLDGSSRDVHEPHRGSQPPPILTDNLNIEAFLKTLPQATSDSVNRFLRTYAPRIDPKLPLAACLKKIEGMFKDFVISLANFQHGHPMSGMILPPQHAGRHPWPQAFHPLHHGHPMFGEIPRHHDDMHTWPPAFHPHYGDNYQHGHPMSGERPPPNAHRHPRPPAFYPHHGDTTLHWGVECDCCGISPIKGSRYKSTKKSDYDLCENCFKAMGNEIDYTKFDRPAHQAAPHGVYRPPCLRRGPKPHMPPRANFARGQYGWKANHPFSGHQSDEHKKLDARFVKDVTIFDGTEVAPGTKFTKIWRLSNIGSLPWPQGTRLVHIGGDVLGLEEAVVLQLPERGVPCGEEMEVLVDLVAPEKAGRYVSHWRLSAPSGQRFGHRVWVVIHVTFEENSPQFQASLQGGEKGVEATEEGMVLDVDGVNTLSFDLGMDGADKILMVVDGVTEVVEQVGASNYESNVRILYPDPLSFDMEDEAEKCKLEEEGFALVEKPNENTADLFDVSDQGMDNSEGPKGRLVEEVPHESLLQALESMGFTDRNLIVSTLRSRNFELEGSVDDLLVAAGWDGALKDLEEMGFKDKGMNVRVLVKNKGSLKQTVKDLVKLEKAVFQG